jgi:hypothetical protein
MDPHKLSAWSTFSAVIIAAITAGIAGCVAYDSNESTKRSERAYLSAVPLGAYNLRPDSSPLQGYLAITNSGKTFGKIIDWQFGVNISEPDNPERIESLGKLRREAGNPVIWPNQPHIAFRELRVLNPAEYQMVRSERGDRRVYVFGFIKYADIFGDEHMTTFCHSYFGSEMAENTNYNVYPATKVNYCEKHNSAN